MYLILSIYILSVTINILAIIGYARILGYVTVGMMCLLFAGIIPPINIFITYLLNTDFDIEQDFWNKEIWNYRR